MQTFPRANQLAYGYQIDPQDITAQYLWVKQRQLLILSLDVIDDSIVFRDASRARRHGGDAIILAVVDKKQRVRRYLLSASAPGQINAYEYLGSYLILLLLVGRAQLRQHGNYRNMVIVWN
ncbi:MAG: hypothetical protein Q9N32_05455 [Gammaproteobacteria bacterium]|nr:hypothetical protein [Gammaproteobacteria bacterium]